MCLSVCVCMWWVSVFFELHWFMCVSLYLCVCVSRKRTVVREKEKVGRKKEGDSD